MHGEKWEYIGNELLHTRYSCHKQYLKLSEQQTDEWDRVEIARLYSNRLSVFVKYIF
jgi:hypothetical protein